MARMALEKLAAGMRLDKPVLNLHGVLLLKAGESLTAKHLEIFKAWGVREADVVREDGGEPEAVPEVPVSAELMQAVQAIVTHRFRLANTNDSPVIAEIVRVVTRRLVQRLASPGRA